MNGTDPQAAPDITPSMKLVLLGQSTVGKTSIITVADGGSLIPDQSATVGACFHIKKMNVGNTTIKFHIWDTAGQDRFKALAPMYYRDAQIALLVYAIDTRESFEDIDEWYNSLQEDCSPLPHIGVVGNKIDLVDRREVTLDEGRALSKRLNAMFFEISAKADAASVRRMLEEIALQAVQFLGQGAGADGKKCLVLNNEQGRCC